jgi:hypothetical protein
MRHLRSILYALVLAPAVWVLAGVGFTHDLTSRGRDFFTAESLSGLLLLVFAGILYAIMAFSPISPAGPALAGAAFIGVTYWAWSSPQAYAGAWPPDVVKDGFDLSRPGYGLAALLAVPLLCTALSARRWARYEPPVLPIIGEIGRFRGSARVAGDTMASVETTVLQTRQPVPSQRRPVAQEDQTQVLRTPQAEPTVALTTADATVALTPAARVAPKAPAAPREEPTTVLAGLSSPSAGSRRPSTTEAAKTNNSGITANPTITAEPAKTAGQPVKPAADDDKTVAMTLPTADKPAAGGDDRTVAVPAQRTGTAPADDTAAVPAQRTGTAPADDATQVIKNPDDEATEVMTALVTPPDDHTEALQLPAK